MKNKTKKQIIIRERSSKKDSIFNLADKIERSILIIVLSVPQQLLLPNYSCDPLDLS